MMTATRILSGLETLDLTGEDASVAARLGFLEWVFSHPGDATAGAARQALEGLPAVTPESDAALAFVSYLREASIPLQRPRARTGRARRLH